MSPFGIIFFFFLLFQFFSMKIINYLKILYLKKKMKFKSNYTLIMYVKVKDTVKAFKMSGYIELL